MSLNRPLIRVLLLVAVVLLGTAASPAAGQCEQAKLTASDARERDLFGDSIAISGDYIVVGAPDMGIGEGQPGRAYVFRREGLTWVQQSKLSASDPQALAYFGNSVSISGSVIVAGAYRAEHKGTTSGAAYVFRRDDNGTATDPSDDLWVEEDKLVPADAADVDFFGVSVSISGNYILAGASWNDDAGTGSGAAYVFWYDGTSWSLQAKLTASDADAYDHFGTRVSLAGDAILVSSSGKRSGYVFRRDGADWPEEAKLTPGDLYADYSIASVAIRNDVAVLGYLVYPAPPLMSAGGGSGAESAYVFRHANAIWTQEGTLSPTEGPFGYSEFGASVSIGQDYILVGAPEDYGQGIPSSGAAYGFGRHGNAWVEERKFIAHDAEPGDSFGNRVAVDGDYIVVAALYDDDACPDNSICDSGSAYVFFLPECPPSIPNVSEWGMVVMAMLLLGIGSVIIKQRKNTGTVTSYVETSIW